MTRPMRHDVIVIGLGVMGAAALDALSARGGSVLGIDRWGAGHAMGSSHGRTRVTRTAYFESPDYVPLLQQSWRAWLELERASGETLLVPTGALTFGPSTHPSVEGVRRAAREHSLRIVELDASELHARFPAIVPAKDDVGILEEQGGVLFAERCVAALLARARAQGAQARTGERVIAIEPGASSVVVVTDRARHEADHVVLAQGAWSEGDASLLPCRIPLVVQRQVQLWWAMTPREHGAPERFPVFVRFGADGCFYGLPDVEGTGAKICMHHGGEPTRAETLDRAVHAIDEARVRAFVRAHVPGASEQALEARVCMYTNTLDGHFAVGAHPEHARVTLACGFSGHGFKLAPAIGRLLADHVIEGSAPLPLFDPLRFDS